MDDQMHGTCLAGVSAGKRSRRYRWTVLKIVLNSALDMD
jgi:hypothetical protein